MSAEALYDAARAYKRELTGEGLSQADVDAFNAILAAWKPAEKPQDGAGPSHGLRDVGAFYEALRAFTGPLRQAQVDGFTSLTAAMAAARWPIAWAAYGLATAWWETAKRMEPVREGYWLKDAEAWRKKNLRYYPHYGRGYVQLTWPANYEKADHELGLGGKLIADLDLALQPDIAAKILVKGMEEGWFTAKSLKTYLPIDGKAGFDAFKAARRIINGQDKAAEIARIAGKFQDALAVGGWA